MVTMAAGLPCMNTGNAPDKAGGRNVSVRSYQTDLNISLVGGGGGITRLDCILYPAVNSLHQCYPRQVDLT